MKITGIEAIELRVPGWRGDSFDSSHDDCVIRVHTSPRSVEVDSVPAGPCLGVSLNEAAGDRFQVK